MYSTIAVPLDGSSFGECALPYAIALARGSGGTVRLLHVHRPYLPGAELEAYPVYQWEGIVDFDLAADADALGGERERLDALAEAITREHGLLVAAQVLRGQIAESLAEYVERWRTDLIVMTTHGHGGLRHAWLGSITDALVRHCCVPILLVRPAARPVAVEAVRFRRILVPIDGSAFSEAMLRPALELAAQAGAAVELLYVAGPDAGAEWRRPQSAEEYLCALAQRFPEELPRPTTRVVGGRPAAAILQEAARGEVDLIALSTHGRGGMRHLVLGSTADAVIRDSAVPVLLLRPHVGTPTRSQALEEPVAR